MKKVLYVSLMIVALMFGATLAYAADGPHGRPSVPGHADGPAHGGSLAHHEGHPQPGIPPRHGMADPHDFRHHRETHVFVVPGFWWAPGWWAPGYPPYAAPPANGQPETQPQSYWYYCQNPQGYYPYVQQCPEGWQTVVPAPPPAG